MKYSYYSDRIMHYLTYLPNAGERQVDNKTIFFSEIGDVTKHLKIKLYIEFDDAIIKRVNYLVYGDGYIIAALGKLSEDLCGLRSKQALNYSFSDLADYLTIPQSKLEQLKLIKNCLNKVISQNLSYQNIQPNI